MGAALAAIILLGPPSPVLAAELRPSGKLDLELGGEVKFYQAFGQLRKRSGERAGARDFVSDATVSLQAVGEDEAMGLRFGAIVERRGSTAELANGDKTFLFLEGRFGELRLGDDDTVQASWSAGADSIAVASGGLDGDIVDSPELVLLGPADSDGTRVAYYSPSFGGLGFGTSYTPHVEDFGDSLGSTASGEVDDLIELALRFEGELGDVEYEAMAGGLVGRLNSGDERRGVRGVIGTLRLELGDLEFAGALAAERVGAVERHFFNIGAAWELEPFAFSLGFGHCFACDAQRTTNLVLGAEVGLVEGVVLGLELSWLDPGADPEARTARSWIGLLGITLEF